MSSLIAGPCMPLSVGIVHFGVGGFHRSHQARYVDRLLRRGEGANWGICGVGVLPGDRRMGEALRTMGMSYVLVERGADGTENATRVGSISEYLFAPDDPRAVLEKIANPQVQLVTLTITEGGYNLDEATGHFDLDSPQIRADLDSQQPPATVFGLLVRGLALRRDRGIGPITVLSCDNVQHNGRIAESAFTQFARAFDPALSAWMGQNVSFPDSMVDRITPASAAEDVAYVNQRYEVCDPWPVVAESFTQWIIEDRFAAGRPPFEKVGAQIVQDVAPYEKFKLRLLNASHQALAYLGLLRGHQYVHDAIADPWIHRQIRAYMEEAAATLDPVEGLGAEQYCETLIGRFGNKAISDTLTRIATDGADRIAKFVMPVERTLLDAGTPAPWTSRIIAAWALAHQIGRSRATPILPPDRQDLEIARLFDAANGDARLMVKSRPVFGELAQSPAFAHQVHEQYGQLLEELERS